MHELQLEEQSNDDMEDELFVEEDQGQAGWKKRE